MDDRLTRHSLLALFLGAALLAGCNGKNRSAPFLGVALAGYPVTPAKLESVRREFPVTPEIVVFFLQWPPTPDGRDFPTASLEAVWATGAIPCITWEPMYRDGDREVAIEHRLIEGYDPYIRDFALKAKQWGKPFIIRFAHEMNLARYHWGTGKEEYGPASPEIYRGMFRHVVDIFRQAGATNVLWAFVPNAESVPDERYESTASWNRIAGYYPGDDYVDILGVDGYNWGTTKTVARDGWDSRWLTFGEIFSAPVRQLRELSTKKPLIVFETASVAQGGDKEGWFRDAVRTTAEWGVRGMVWFQENKEEEWRISGATLPDRPVRQGNAPQEWLRGIAAGNRR